MKTLYLCGAGNPEGVRLALTVNEKEGRWDRIIILDDNPSRHGKEILGIKVAGPFDLLKEADQATTEVSNMVARTTAGRRSAHKKIKSYDLPLVSLIHPLVDLRGVTLGEEITIYSYANLCADSSVADSSVVFTGGVVGHGCRVGRGCVVAPGAVINARVELGEGVYVGTNASILPDLKIGSWATIGINSAVVENVPAGATVMGVPAQVITMPGKSVFSGSEGLLESPDTEAEKIIADIWKEVLGVAAIQRQDNFFELGGQSLIAMQIISRLNDVFKVELSVRALFDTPTIAGLADHLQAILSSTNRRRDLPQNGSFTDEREEIEF